MKTMLNISLLLMVAAGSAGAANFISMYRTGDIDRIYVEDEKPTVAHSTNSIQPVEPVTAAVEEETKTEPATLVTTKKKKMVAVAPVVTGHEIVTTSDAPAKMAEAPITTEPAATKTIAEVVATPDNVVVEKEVKKTPKKFKLKMYSRAMIRDDFEEIAEEPVAKPDTLSTKEAKVWDY